MEQDMHASSRTSSGFTLSELVVALALVSLLLIGISNVFSLTSNTISTGTALGDVLRSQRAIGNQLSLDFLGYSASGNIVQSDDNSGIIPIGAAGSGNNNRQPAIVISNYRVAAFRDENDQKRDLNYTDPTGRPATTTSEIFVADSSEIRTIDLNNDGDETDPGETIPIFQVGTRNFRVDSISFFVKGTLTRQTGDIRTASPSFVSPLTSNEAWIYYGAPRVFVGSDPGTNGANLDYTNYYSAPGIPWTRATTATISNPASQRNQNQRYASQFKLARCAWLLAPLKDGAVRTDDYSIQTFLSTVWGSNPQDASSDTANPFTSDAAVAGPSIGNDFALRSSIPKQAGTGNYESVNGICDVIGTTASLARERLKFTTQLKYDTAMPTAAARLTAFRSWCNGMYNGFEERPWINPFPQTLNPRAIAQRTQLMGEGVSQFTVEFAGNFVTQDASGAVTAAVPDVNDEIDYIAATASTPRRIRWYGLPRDVDGDGDITNNTTDPTSSDVVPLRDVAGVRMPFEIVVPTALPLADYAAVTTDLADQDGLGYVVAFGPHEFDGTELIDVYAGGQQFAPKLIRITIEQVDPAGKLQQPIVQEYVFPVR
jgi:prepilin-type N-terminal cleavage/methylation domain-containing protein